MICRKVVSKSDNRQNTGDSHARDCCARSACVGRADLREDEAGVAPTGDGLRRRETGVLRNASCTPQFSFQSSRFSSIRDGHYECRSVTGAGEREQPHGLLTQAIS